MIVKRDEVWVYADVVCDLFHAGHIEFFQKTRSLGDRLIVGLVSDEDVRTYKPAPIMTFAERLAVVRSCRYVDHALDVPAPLYCTCDFLDQIGADFVCHGDDLSPEEMAHWYADLIVSNRVRVIPYTPGISTRKIVERIRRRLREDDI